MIEILPSIICADYLNLQKDLDKIKQSKAKYLHIDIMDGNFVPQITIGHDFVRQIQKHTDLKLDIHLMVSNPEIQIDFFLDLVPEIITFHYEVTNEHQKLLTKIKNANIKTGLAIKPNTEILEIEDLIKSNLIDVILIMTVEPGKSGQIFLNESLNKILELQILLKKYNLKNQIIIEVDGGINKETMQLCYKNGARYFAVGNYIFQNKDLIIEKINNLYEY